MTQQEKAEPKKLKLSCGTVDCANGLHCYQLTKREASHAVRQAQQTNPNVTGTVPAGGTTPSNGSLLKTPIKAGPIKQCKACGLVLVDWERVRERELADVKNTFAAMKTEWIRHQYWHRPIDRLAVAYAFKLGRKRLKERLRKLIWDRVGHAPASELYRDGYQTSWGTTPAGPNILYFAQHATASCCRSCVAEWHGISKDRSLRESELDYLTALAMLYIEDRLPTLPADGGAKPPRGAFSRATVDSTEGRQVSTVRGGSESATFQSEQSRTRVGVHPTVKSEANRGRRRRHDQKVR